MKLILRVILCVLLSLIFGGAYYLYIYNELSENPLELITEIEGESFNGNKKIDLYVKTIDNDKYITYSPHLIVETEYNYKAYFKLHYPSDSIKLLRLDFENFNQDENIAIKYIKIVNSSGFTIAKVSGRQLLRKTFGYSYSIDKGEKKIYFKDTDKAFDPYIIFNISSIFFYNNFLSVLIVLPWLILFIKPTSRFLVKKLRNKEFFSILILMFFLVLPLKIAWVTFICIIALAFSVYEYLTQPKKTIEINLILLFFPILFILFLLSGNINSFADLNIEYSFLIVPLTFLLADRSKIIYSDYIKGYVYIFSFLLIIIILHSIFFLILFDKYSDISVVNYFQSEFVKEYNQKMLFWLPYSHPTFLSCFFLVGMIFSQALKKIEVIGICYLRIYCILTLLVLMLLGSRLMIGAWALLIISFYLYSNTNKLFAFLSFSTLSFIILLTLFICKIDHNRCILWTISTEAIIQNLNGYGIGTSNDILHNEKLLDKLGFSPPVENHSHNQFITVFLENGAVTLIIFVALILYVGYYIYRKMSRELMMIYFLFLLLLLTESLFETSTITYFFTLMFCLLSISKLDSKLDIKYLN